MRKKTDPNYKSLVSSINYYKASLGTGSVEGFNPLNKAAHDVSRSDCGEGLALCSHVDHNKQSLTSYQRDTLALGGVVVVAGEQQTAVLRSLRSSILHDQ
jgi:hypothetical protein